MGVGVVRMSCDGKFNLFPDPFGGAGTFMLFNLSHHHVTNIPPDHTIILFFSF